MNQNLGIISEDRRLFRHFTIRYGIALTFIAVLSIVSQVRIQQHLNRSMDDSHVINFAARLRTYSQILCKSALQLENGHDVEINGKEFVNTLRQWEKAQEGLQAGSKFLNLPTENMEEINEMFELISHPRQEMMAAAEHIVTILDTTKPFQPQLIRPYVKTILDYEQSYLLGMDLIVFDYDRFSKERIRQLKQIDYLMLAMVLATLLLEAAFIFYPLALHIKKTVVGLVSSEEKARKLTEDLRVASDRMERSYNELKKKERENRQLTEEKIRREGIEQKIRSYAIINGQEKERKRIAAEVHDGIGQMLTSLRMKLEQIEDRAEAPDPEVATVNNMLARLITETRRICSDLLPSVLEDFGLLSAIEDLVKTCKDADRRLEFFLDANIRKEQLSRELEISVYRIIQEGLNNVVKHAAATKVEIYLDTSGGCLELMIRDNGKGFYFDHRQLHLKNMAKKMNGIRGMKERAELLNGTFNISTEPGKGTIIQLEIPL
ncbi:sensor histidine kinase [Chitinophaga japonensis]|uniref:Signal transduction histidine kinase n=1 Tax=Chitinophaga japonensis TaxID=104662 RepID=A0A562T883_CHIJA|nr:sensor histidine kinase [Chitinophaga japonensis]TWI89070.1 signal transduction histidine kinase [Chitinophaga japonensis]